MDELRIGLIGVANRGGYFAREFHEHVDEARVVAGMDVREENLARFREVVGSDVFTTQDYRELVNREDVDAVVIASPDNYHEEHGLAALEAGKHLLLEKPMAITVEGCDRLLKAWKKAGTVFGLGLSMRYMPMFEVMKDIIDSGDIGEPKAYWCNHFVGKGGHFYFHDWHAVRANTTGLLLQKGTHDLDIMHYLVSRFTTTVSAFGSLDVYGGDKPNDLHCPDCEEKDTCPEAQLNEKHRYFQLCAFRQEIDVEDNHVLIMELEGGIKAAYQECHFTPDYHRDHIVIGTKGKVWNSEDYTKVWVRMRRAYGLADREYQIHPPEGSHGGGDVRLCRDFLAAVREHRPMRNDPLSARMAVAAGVAGHESLRNGGSVVTVARPEL